MKFRDDRGIALLVIQSLIGTPSIATSKWCLTNPSNTVSGSCSGIKAKTRERSKPQAGKYPEPENLIYSHTKNPWQCDGISIS